MTVDVWVRVLVIDVLCACAQVCVFLCAFLNRNVHIRTNAIHDVFNFNPGTNISRYICGCSTGGCFCAEIFC